MRSVTALVALAVVVALPQQAAGQEHAHPEGDAESVGRISFPVSCSAEAAARFEVGAAMLHSFWFEAAERTFREAAAADPSCAMAHWGLAMTYMGNPMARIAPSAERMRAGRAAAEAARDLARAKPHREQMYADAVVAYYDGDTRDHPTRMRAHEEALGALHRMHGDDIEATIFYARAMVANAPPADLTFARQLAGAQLMQPLFDANPRHPGLAHYIIHAYDAPALARQGAKAAFAYARIAPAAPHALHMPSHIFTRLGYWDESIETNARSAQAEPVPDAAVHPLDYMVYAYLQQGRDREAKTVVDRSLQRADRFYGGVIGYNFVAMPARYALERERWADAAALPISDGMLPWIEAVTRFARAVGAARSGNPDAARADVDGIARLHAAIVAQNDAYWATIVEAQRLAAEAWIARARGDDVAALRLAGAAADLEETVEKHPVTPGPILPARELLGDLLMQLGRPADALAAYETTLVREPRRARALYGAARAAEATGSVEAARAHYRLLLEVMAKADEGRPQVAEARRFLGT